ncbi:MAG: hypothetical protein RLZZ301_1044 [Bacteroidota bacterium]|jgi:hypothetical protein
MSLKSKYLRNILLALYVVCYSVGLFNWARVFDKFDLDFLSKALAHGLLIGLIYFGFQTKDLRPKKGIYLLSLAFVVAFYLFAYKSSLPFLWFWCLLLLQLLLLVTYVNGLAWRRIMLLKNLLIATMWYIQLNLIPALAGNVNLAYLPFFIFYLALSIQVDAEDIEEDNGKIKTFASKIGKETSAFLVIFLLAFFAYLMGLPFVWILLALLVAKRETFLPKRSYDALLFLLGIYFMLR